MSVTRMMLAALLTVVTAAELSAEAQVPAHPQARATAATTADSKALRALAAATPPLALDRLEVKLSPPMRLGDVSAVGTDKQGNIYILHRPRDPNIDPIVVIDAKGNVLRSFGRGQFAIPHGIKVDSRGNVWTVDAHTSAVTEFSPNGKILLKIDVGGVPDFRPPFCGATNLAFAADGRFYVADGYCNGRIIAFAPDGTRTRQWGKKGVGEGGFNVAHDVSVSADGTVFVADRENGRVQWFDGSGRFLGQKHFGGQLFSAQAGADGIVYVGVRARDAAGYADGSYVFAFDPQRDRVIGRVDAFAHQLTVGEDGSLLPGTVAAKIGNDLKTTSILLFRPKAK